MSPREQRAGELYERFAGTLSGLMRHRYGIPETEVENILHDIFASFLRSTTPILHDEKWLIGTACNLSRRYWRSAGTEINIFGEESRTHAELEQVITLRQILTQLPKREEEVLRLRYLEGFSGEEVAIRYGTSVGYIHLLVHRSLEKARSIARGEN